MIANEKLEVRIKNSIRPVFTPFKDEDLLNEISKRVIEKVTLIESLDNSYHPMNELVISFYQLLDQELGGFKQRLVTSPENVKKNLEVRTFQNERYDILKDVIRALLLEEINNYYSKFNLEIGHFVHHEIDSFSSSRRVMEEKEIEVGVAIGPEGFTYATIFNLLGLKVRNIHIDEFCLSEDRPYKELDDLSVIRGKHTLLIEDDIVTGKTLEKAYAQIKKHSPASISVYLGIPERKQRLENLPKKLRKVYTTPEILDNQQIQIEIDEAIKILGKKYPIFKNN